MARIDTRAHGVVVARSTLAEGRVATAGTHPTVRLRPGEKLVLAHAYEAEESSPLRETFGFHLAARGKEAGIVLRDRPLVVDDRKGTLTLAFRFAEPGRHVVPYEAWAEYRVAPWLRRSKPGERRAVAGRVTVLVA